MATNINEIWQQQDISKEELDKYLHRKESESHDLLFQLANKYQANVKWIGIGAILSLLIFPAAELYFIGLALSLTFASVYFISSKRLETLQGINKDKSCYHYLTDYRAYLHDSQAFYGRLYQFVYPLLYTGVLAQFFTSTTGSFFLQSIKDEGATLFLGMPISVLGYSTISIGLVAISAKALYNKEVDYIYGQEFTMLDELICELEQLS